MSQTVYFDSDFLPAEPFNAQQFVSQTLYPMYYCAEGMGIRFRPERRENTDVRMELTSGLDDRKAWPTYQDKPDEETFSKLHYLTTLRTKEGTFEVSQGQNWLGLINKINTFYGGIWTAETLIALGINGFKERDRNLYVLFSSAVISEIDTPNFQPEKSHPFYYEIDEITQALKDRNFTQSEPTIRRGHPDVVFEEYVAFQIAKHWGADVPDVKLQKGEKGPYLEIEPIDGFEVYSEKIQALSPFNRYVCRRSTETARLMAFVLGETDFFNWHSIRITETAPCLVDMSEALRAHPTNSLTLKSATDFDLKKILQLCEFVRLENRIAFLNRLEKSRDTVTTALNACSQEILQKGGNPDKFGKAALNQEVITPVYARISHMKDILQKQQACRKAPKAPQQPETSCKGQKIHRGNNGLAILGC